VRLTSLWGVGGAAALALVFAVAGGPAIDLMTTAPELQEKARAFLPWVVAAPLVGIASWMFDGIFIGATRTREMRDAMLGAVLLYAAALWLFWGFGNHGLWAALTVLNAGRGVLMALYYPRIPESLGARPPGLGRPANPRLEPVAAPAADGVGDAGMAVARQTRVEPLQDVADQPEAPVDQRRIELQRARPGADLGIGGLGILDPADADQGQLPVVSCDSCARTRVDFSNNGRPESPPVLGSRCALFRPSRASVVLVAMIASTPASTATEASSASASRRSDRARSSERPGSGGEVPRVPPSPAPAARAGPRRPAGRAASRYWARRR
jgi:hypothetical protein